MGNAAGVMAPDPEPLEADAGFADVMPFAMTRASFHAMTAVDSKIEPTAAEPVCIQDFDLLEVVGTGGFGKVWKAQRKGTKQIYAIKIQTNNQNIKSSEAQALLRERRVLETTDCPFVVKLHWTLQNFAYSFLVLTFVPGGTLFQLQNSVPNQIFSERETAFYTMQTCLGLSYLHKNMVCFRDLKPENLLIDRHGNVKLSDFGLSKVGNSHDIRHQSILGTPEYMAPEMIQGHGYSYEVDYWALGCLVYEMLHSSSPFYEASTRNMFVRILTGNHHDLKPALSTEAQAVVRGLIFPDPEQRFGISHLTKHPFFKPWSWKEVEAGNCVPPIKPETKKPKTSSQASKSPHGRVPRLTHDAMDFEEAEDGGLQAEDNGQDCRGHPWLKLQDDARHMALMGRFMELRSESCLDREVWASVLDERFIFTLPSTVYRQQLAGHCLQENTKVLVGIDAFIHDLSAGRRSVKPGLTVTGELDFIVDHDAAIPTSDGLVVFGNVKSQTTPAATRFFMHMHIENDLVVRVDKVLDVEGFGRQFLDAVKADESRLEALTNSTEMSLPPSPKANAPKAITFKVDTPASPKMTPSKPSARTKEASEDSPLTPGIRRRNSYKDLRRVRTSITAFEFLDKIGEGQFGSVWRVRSSTTGKVVAVKCIAKHKLTTSNGGMDQLIRERDLHARLSHPFIVELLSAHQSSSQCMLVMGFVAGGSLSELMAKQPQRRFSNREVRFYGAEVALALKHMHSNSIALRDLKPEHVLLAKDGHIKLIDFGLACVMADPDPTQPTGNPDRRPHGQHVGNVEYTPPELLTADAVFGFGSDWWCYGCLLLELLTGESPFHHQNVQVLHSNISHGFDGLDLPSLGVDSRDSPPEVSEALSALLRGLLRVDPASRFGWTDVETSDYFASGLPWNDVLLKKADPPSIISASTPTDHAGNHGRQPDAPGTAVPTESLESQLAQAQRFFSLFSSCCPNVDEWAAVVERTILFSTPRLPFRVQSTSSVCPITKLNFVFGIDELAEEMENARLSQPRMVEFAVVPSSYCFTERRAAACLTVKVDNTTTPGAVKLAFSSSGKLVSVEICFDVHAFMSKWAQLGDVAIESLPVRSVG